MRASERPAPATGAGLSEDVAAKPLFEIESTATTDNSVGVQLRRRRAASLHCEPLADGTGRRDPLDVSASRDRWTSPRVLHVEKGPRNTAWLHGGRLKQLCEHANVPHLYDHSLKTWRISMRRVDDLIVYAEHIEGRFVTTELVDR
jgi:hypothetical protein